MTFVYHVRCNACTLDMDKLGKRQAEDLERSHALEAGHRVSIKQHWVKEE